MTHAPNEDYNMQDQVDHVSFWPSVEIGCVANILEEYTATSSW
jgi:hypothetical protein